jgi:hypothetical protein
MATLYKVSACCDEIATFGNIKSNVGGKLLLSCSYNCKLKGLYVLLLCCYCVIQDGVYIKGLYLEGAGFDQKNSVLCVIVLYRMVCTSRGCT